MILIFILSTLLYVTFYLTLAVEWTKIKPNIQRSSSTRFSIIIPVRNEEKVIEKLLVSLEFQEYDKENYEVIVVDDFSEDATVARVEELMKRFRMDLRVFSLEDVAQTGKKIALTKGIEAAKNDFILTTDADCQMGPYWLSSFAENASTKKFIAGPVALKGSGLFAQMQQSEFAGLIGFGAVTMTKGSPSMCSGANLGFTKDAFLQVGGYTDNLDIPSGDDEFLLYHVYKKYPNEVLFLKSKAAIVVTEAHSKLSKFINQRIRWTSKWKYHKNRKLRLTAMLFFLDNLVFLAAFFLFLTSQISAQLFLPLLIARWLIIFVYILPIKKFLGHGRNFAGLLLMQIIYPFHILFMGLNSIFGRYTWKGRKY